jgi:diguanylate cyclase (GGDEF)-like protein
MWKKIKTNKQQIYSLRARAILFSVSISLLIVVISVVGYSNIKTFQKDTSLQIKQRDDFLISLSLIRGKLLDSYKEINQFLLTPENKNYQEQVILNINSVYKISLLLKNHYWIRKYRSEKTAEQLVTEVALLGEDVNELIRVRLDPTNQYPSLDVGSKIMQPNRDKLNNLLALAILEANQDNSQIDNPEVYKTLIQSRHLWTQVLSNFRLYLANRVGSFNKQALPVQERAIEVMFKQLQAELLKLKNFSDSGKLGFESTDAMPAILDSSVQWYKGFVRVKVILHSDEWRRDAQIMKMIISPRIDSITRSLILLETIVGSSSEYDIKLYESLSYEQNKVLWLVAFLGLFFTGVILLYLDKLIFKPIALISQALKLEARGKKSDDLIVVKTKETEELVNAFSDMSYQVHLRQKELEYRALHDALTTLPNRTLLLDRIGHHIDIAKRETQELSLLILDLDNFKEVNDTLGHFAGDDLLIEVGARIKNILRDVDTIARIGGDEFSVLLPHTNEEQAIIISEKILSLFMKTINIGEVDVSISSSIGIAVYPFHGEDVDTLLRHADIAMYVAKRNKLGFEVYSEELDEHSIARLSLTRDFRDAMTNDQLSIHFQPIVDFNGEKILAVEVLSRWLHSEYGLVSPEKFILLAEQTSLINSLTYWVLDKSISQVSAWNKSGYNLLVAVNLSVFSFKDPGFISEVRGALKKYNFPAENLKLEITESAMMDNPLQAVEMLTELREMGVKLSIDDFGTGFSSMAYLKQLPVDELKIDKSFIIGLDDDANNDAIVRSTIDLAHNLGLKVVAEGIETKTVYQLLKRYGCDMAQGYYLSHPVPAKELFKLLSK